MSSQTRSVAKRLVAIIAIEHGAWSIWNDLGLCASCSTKNMFMFCGLILFSGELRDSHTRFQISGGSYFTKFLFYDSKRFYVAHTCQAGVAWHISQIWELILFSQEIFTHISDLGAHTFQSGVFAHISHLGAHTFQSGVTWPILQI